jgi:hypothetical protein
MEPVASPKRPAGANPEKTHPLQYFSCSISRYVPHVIAPPGNVQ